MTLRRCAALVFTTVLLVAGCSSSNDQPPSAGGNAEVGTTSDINPQDPANLRQGGSLRLALPSFPANFNTLHIDGNEGPVAAMMRWTLPRAFRVGPDGSTTVNTDYFTSIELTSEDPQVVTYTINPQATWSDGTPITWEDIASQTNATNGKNKDFAIASAAGSDRVASVTRGVDDRQAVMTFAAQYTEWQGMFAGNGMLLPKAMTENPEVFNRGQLSQPGPSAGPFIRHGVEVIAGVDEAGRGACAGPVVAGAAVLPPGEAGVVPGLADSKLLTEKGRERAYAEADRAPGGLVGGGRRLARRVRPARDARRQRRGAAPRRWPS